jgi:hypothetical protein
MAVTEYRYGKGQAEDWLVLQEEKCITHVELHPDDREVIGYQTEKDQYYKTFRSILECLKEKALRKHIKNQSSAIKNPEKLSNHRIKTLSIATKNQLAPTRPKTHPPTEQL